MSTTSAFLKQVNQNSKHEKCVATVFFSHTCNRMHVTHSETQYTDSHRSPKPTAHVLFTANFSNDTPNPQRYTLRTERRTKSTCNIALCKTYTIGAHVEIKVRDTTGAITPSNK